MYYAHVKRLHSVKWQSLYGDTATMQELFLKNVYKFCIKKSGMKLSLNRVWNRTAALTCVSRSRAQKIVEEKKKAQDERQQPKQPPSSTSKVSLDDFDEDVVRRTVASMYSLKKVLQTLDNIRTEYWLHWQHWQQGSSSQRSPSYEVCLHTMLGESKSADEETRRSPQQDQMSSHGQGVERGGLHSR